jgi:hypothetical protein
MCLFLLFCIYFHLCSVNKLDISTIAPTNHPRYHVWVCPTPLLSLIALTELKKLASRGNCTPCTYILMTELFRYLVTAYNNTRLASILYECIFISERIVLLWIIWVELKVELLYFRQSTVSKSVSRYKSQTYGTPYDRQILLHDLSQALE